MKKIFLIVALLTGLICSGQVFQVYNQYGGDWKGLRAKRVLMMPTGCGDPVALNSTDAGMKSAASYFDSCGNKYWLYNPKTETWAGMTAVDQNLQQVTDQGYRTTDTIFTGGLGTSLIMADTAQEDEFEIAVIPDTQKEVETWPAIGRTTFQMLADSATAWNLKAAISVGDLQDNGITSQMDTVSQWYDILDDANIPNVPVLGNHDYDNNNPAAGRPTTIFNTFFGPSRYAAKPWYGGSRDGTTNDNYWIYFDVGSKKYAVVALELFPRDEVLTWANTLTDSLADRDVIVTTHAYITIYGERGVDTSLWANNYLGIADNNGQELWDNYLKLHRNIKFVFNGHYITNMGDSMPQTKSWSDVGIYGNIVHQTFVNYQFDTSGGNGYFMRMKFKPAEGKIDVGFYSSYRKKYDERLQSFSLYYPGLRIENTAAIVGDLIVKGMTRFDSTAHFPQLQKHTLVYVGDNNQLKDTSTLGFNPITGQVTMPRFLAGLPSYVTNFGTTVNNSFEGLLPGTFNVSHGSSNYGLTITKAAADNGAANLTFYHTYNATPTTRTALPDGGTALVGRITYQSPDLSGNVRIGADLRVSNNIARANHVSYDWEFRTADTTTGTLTTRARLFANGEMGFGTNPTIIPSAKVFINSTTQGFLPPRMTAAQRLAITPVAGLIVYDTDSARLFVYNTAWHGLKHTDEGGGGSGTPAGNFGNVQINRWGSFDSPGSDSLDFDGGLKVKGVLNVDGSGTNFFDVTANAISALMNGSGFDHNFTFGSGNITLSRVPDVSGVSSSLNLSTSATLNSQNTTGPESFIQASPDSITLDSDVGRFQIPTVETSTDTTLNKPMVWNLSTKRLTRLDRWPVGSGGGDVFKVGTPVNNQLGVWTGDGTIEGPSTLTYDGTQFYNSANQTANSGIRSNSIEIQGYGVNNAWFGDNIYYDAGFKYRADGYATQFYFYTGEGQFRMNELGSAGTSAAAQKIPLKINVNQTVGIGGDMSATAGTFTGAELIAATTGVTINEDGADRDFRIESDALTEAFRIDGSTGEPRMAFLAGTGSRAVVADAEGDLSAPVSDRSVKENIRRLQPGINAIMKLKPVSFEYKTGYKNYGAGVQMGFIAQDIQKIFPNSVYRNNSNGKLGYNATDLIPVLVKAVQDQQKQIDELKELVKILMQKK